MKASALMFWSLLGTALGQALTNGSSRNPCKKLYVFHTPYGPFYIGEFKKRFYPIFRDEMLGSYSTPEDAAEDLAYGRSVVLCEIDLVALRIPRDLAKWQRL
jgi:hypothetical protein